MPNAEALLEQQQKTHGSEIVLARHFLLKPLILLGCKEKGLKLVLIMPWVCVNEEVTISFIFLDGFNNHFRISRDIHCKTHLATTSLPSLPFWPAPSVHHDVTTFVLRNMINVIYGGLPEMGMNKELGGQMRQQFL